MSTIITISAQDARRKFGELLDKADYRNESFVIERSGQAKAAIVPMAEYNEMLRMKSESKKRLFAIIDEVQKRTSEHSRDEIKAAVYEASEK